MNVELIQMALTTYHFKSDIIATPIFLKMS